MTTTLGIPLAQVRRTSNQTIPTNDPTAVVFQVADYDYSTALWQSGNKSRLKAPPGVPGYYLIYAEAAFHVPDAQSTVNSLRRLSLRVNGSATPETFRQSIPNVTFPVADTELVTAGLIHLDAGDYVELIARQDSSVDGSILAGAELTMVLMLPDSH